MLESLFIIIAVCAGVFIGSYLEKRSSESELKRLWAMLASQNEQFAKSLAESHQFSEKIGGILKGMAHQAHNLTIKSFAHVQPAAIDVIKAQNVNDSAEKSLNLWGVEEERPEIPDANLTSPREFVSQLEEVLKAGKG